MYLKTLDALYSHSYFCPLYSNTCRLRVYETPPNQDPLPTVFIATQLPDNAGTSVTNAAEELASEVVRLHRARRELTAQDPRCRMIWIQHYPESILDPLDSEERFSIVRFSEMPEGTLLDPVWERVSRTHVEDTILHACLDG